MRDTCTNILSSSLGFLSRIHANVVGTSNGSCDSRRRRRGSYKEDYLDDTSMLCSLLKELTENTCRRKLLWRTTTYESHLAYLAERGGNLLLLVPRAPMEMPRLLLQRSGRTDIVEDLASLPTHPCTARAVNRLYEAVRDSILRHRNSAIDTLALFLLPEQQPPPPPRQH